jgi:hypothetical protein
MLAKNESVGSPSNLTVFMFTRQCDLPQNEDIVI